jgi:hypothetical protein
VVADRVGREVDRKAAVVAARWPRGRPEGRTGRFRCWGGSREAAVSRVDREVVRGKVQD